MAGVTVQPQTFTMVRFDAAVIGGWATEVASRVGLPDGTAVAIEIDEASPLARWSVGDGDPITIRVDGGAFEDTRRPREMGRRRTRDVVGRALLRVLDRRADAFAGAPPDEELTLAQSVAWDVYSVGRLARLFEDDGQRQRRLYQFRNRHGFTDAADEAFDRIWSATDLSWAELDAISETARSVLAEQ